MYDVSSLASFQNVMGWIKTISEEGRQPLKVMLIGTKKDKPREVPIKVIQVRSSTQVLVRRMNCLKKAFAEENNIKFMETSAKEGENVEEIFVKMANELDMLSPSYCHPLVLPSLQFFQHICKISPIHL